MNVLFIRHAAAEEHSPSGDHGRRLTENGREQAKRDFEVLARHYGAVELILTSPAVRAKETASILSEAFSQAQVVESESLNPGCSFEEFRKVVHERASGTRRIAVVGHEPDFSHIIARIIGDGGAHVEMKKGSCAEVELESGGRGYLRLLLPAGAATAMGARENLQEGG